MSASVMRGVSLVAVAASSVGSFGLMLRSGNQAPLLLIIAFTFWVLSPLAALLWANVVSTRWSKVTRSTLYGVTLVVALGSLALYSEFVDVRPKGAPNAFLWVVVPPAAWAFIAITMSTAAFISRKSRH